MRSSNRTHPETKGSATRTRQRGAAAIEFAFIFPLFFAILYAVVSYSMALLLQMGMSSAAADGARAAVQLVDPLQFNQVGFNAAAKQRITQAVRASLAWLPASKVDAIVANIDISTAPDPGNGAGSASGVRVNVLVQWKDYSSAPLIPVIDLPLVGKVPNLPDDLNGSASMLLR
jgi:Flp pilus assembly protein TadG